MPKKKQKLNNNLKDITMKIQIDSEDIKKLKEYHGISNEDIVNIIQNIIDTEENNLVN